MKKYVLISLVPLLCACAPTIHYFNVTPFIDSHYKEMDDSMTIALDNDIPNDYHFREANLQNFRVHHFRRTLNVSLFNTFEGSFNTVSTAAQISETGWSLALYRVRPFFEIVPLAEENHTKVLVRYEAALFYDGERKLVMDDQALSEDIAIFRSDVDEVFEEAVQQMCKQIYISTVQEYNKQVTVKR